MNPINNNENGLRRRAAINSTHSSIAPQVATPAGSSAAHAAADSGQVERLSDLTPGQLENIAGTIQESVTPAIQNLDLSGAMDAINRLEARLRDTQQAGDITTAQAGEAVAELAEGVARPIMQKVAQAVANTVLSSMRNAFVVVVAQPSVTWSPEALACDSQSLTPNPLLRAAETTASSINHKIVPTQMVGVYLPNTSPDQALIQITKRNEYNVSTPAFSIPPLQLEIGAGFFSATEDVYDFNIDLKKRNQGSGSNTNDSLSSIEQGNANNANNADNADNAATERGRLFNQRYMTQNHKGVFTSTSYAARDDGAFSLNAGRVDMEFRQNSFYLDENNTDDRKKAIKMRAALENGAAAALGFGTYGLARATGISHEPAVGAAHVAAVEGLGVLRPVLNQVIPPSESGTVSERDYFAFDIGSRIATVGEAEIQFAFLVHLAESTGFQGAEPKVVDVPLPFVGQIEINPTRSTQIDKLLTQNEATSEVVASQLSNLRREVENIQQTLEAVAPNIDALNQEVGELAIRIQDNNNELNAVNARLLHANEQLEDERARTNSLQFLGIDPDTSRLDGLSNDVTELINEQTELLTEKNELDDKAQLVTGRATELQTKRDRIHRSLNAKVAHAEKLEQQQTKLSSITTGLNNEAAAIQRRKDNNDARAEARVNSNETQTQRRNALRERFRANAQHTQVQRFERESKKDI